MSFLIKNINDCNLKSCNVFEVGDLPLTGSYLRKRGKKSSSPGEFHPQALTDPDVNVSAHPALIIQSQFLTTSPYPLAPPIPG